MHQITRAAPAMHNCYRMAPKRARSQSLTRPGAAIVEPTRTRSRTAAPMTGDHPPTGQQPPVTRGRPRTRAGRPGAGRSHLSGAWPDVGPTTTDRSMLIQQPLPARGRPRTRAGRSAAARSQQSGVQTDAGYSATRDTDLWDATAAPLLESEAATVARRRWEEAMEDRVQQSNNLLQQMHQMLTEQRKDPIGLTSDDHVVGECVTVSPQLTHVTALGQPVGNVALTESALPRVTASGLATPWPSSDGFETGVGGVLDRLPIGTQDRVRAFTSSAVSLHAHVSDKTRALVWAGEFVELATLLPQRKAVSQELALGLQGAEDGTSVVCIEPKAKPAITSFPLWSKAFQIYMSIYLSQPVHYHEAPPMLKYIQTIRDLSERGYNWQVYDESFRSFRVLHNWGWDTVESELWLQASRTVSMPFGGAPFHGKGGARRPAQSSNPCFTYNKGLHCDSRKCRYQHKCKRCGAGHPVTQCPRIQYRQTSTAGLPAITSRINPRQ